MALYHHDLLAISSWLATSRASPRNNLFRLPTITAQVFSHASCLNRKRGVVDGTAPANRKRHVRAWSGDPRLDAKSIRETIGCRVANSAMHPRSSTKRARSPSPERDCVSNTPQSTPSRPHKRRRARSTSALPPPEPSFFALPSVSVNQLTRLPGESPPQTFRFARLSADDFFAGVPQLSAVGRAGRAESVDELSEDEDNDDAFFLSSDAADLREKTIHTLPSIRLDETQFDHDDAVSVRALISVDVLDDKDEVDFDTGDESDAEDHAGSVVVTSSQEWIMVCEDPFASENSVTVLYDGHDEHCLYVSFQPGLDVRYVMRGFGDIENADGRITSEDMEAVNTVAYPGNKLEFRKTSSAEISETQVLITAENCGSGLFVVNISCHPRLRFTCEGQGYFGVVAPSS